MDPSNQENLRGLPVQVMHEMGELKSDIMLRHFTPPAPVLQKILQTRSQIHETFLLEKELSPRFFSPFFNTLKNIMKVSPPPEITRNPHVFWWFQGDRSEETFTKFLEALQSGAKFFLDSALISTKMFHKDLRGICSI